MYDSGVPDDTSVAILHKKIAHLTAERNDTTSELEECHQEFLALTKLMGEKNGRIRELTAQRNRLREKVIRLSHRNYEAAPTAGEVEEWDLDPDFWSGSYLDKEPILHPGDMTSD